MRRSICSLTRPATAPLHVCRAMHLLSSNVNKTWRFLFTWYLLCFMLPPPEEQQHGPADHPSTLPPTNPPKWKIHKPTDPFLPLPPAPTTHPSHHQHRQERKKNQHSTWRKKASTTDQSKRIKAEINPALSACQTQHHLCWVKIQKDSCGTSASFPATRGHATKLA